MLSTEKLYEQLPHSGNMRLLDHVEHWDQTMIRCSTQSHQLPNNPLRLERSLPALCGLEYAAQAFALHGALINQQRATQSTQEQKTEAYIVNVQEILCHLDDLSKVNGPLFVDAKFIAQQQDAALYDFRIFSEQTSAEQLGTEQSNIKKLCLSGNVGVILK